MEIKIKKKKIESILHMNDDYTIWKANLLKKYKPEMYIGGLDLSLVSQEEALEWLEKEGYKKHPPYYDTIENINGNYSMLLMYDPWNNDNNSKFIRRFNQIEYFISHTSYDMSDALHFIGGGMNFSNMCYKDGIPNINIKLSLHGKYRRTIIPKGNIICPKEMHRYIIGSLLLLARNYSTTSPFYKYYLPLDMFKLIFKLVNLF
jgi:hypothetical protein